MKVILKHKKVAEERNDNQNGATIIIVALMLVVLLGFAALAIDIGYVMAARNEAQNVADAAALAGAGELGYELWDTGTYEQNVIKAVTKEVANKNQVTGENFILDEADIEICRWNWETDQCDPLDPNDPSPTAVRVKVRKDNIGTFFARILKIDFFNTSAVATAALSGVSKPPENLIPVGIPSYWYEHEWGGDFCDQTIKFYPSNDIEGCAGWHVFTEKNHTPKTLWDIMEQITDGTYDYPETELGVTEYDFTGGTLSSALCQKNKYSFEDMYNDNKDDDGNWEVSGAVYSGDDCDNPKGEYPIVGYTTIIIHNVDCEDKSLKAMDATVVCDKLADSRGGGGEFGLLGRIPGLVE